MRKTLRFLAASILAVTFTAGTASAGTRERLSLDAGWLFHLGDVIPPAARGHGMSYGGAKAGNAGGAADRL